LDRHDGESFQWHRIFSLLWVGGIGDWAEFIQGLGPQWLWRIGLAVFGFATYLLAVRISLLDCVR